MSGQTAPLSGIPASHGIGTAVLLRPQSLTYEPHPVEDKAAEKARLQAAIQRFIQDTQAVADTFGKRLDARDAEILTGHIDMIQDPFLQEEMWNRIDEGMCAEAAAEAVLEMFKALFQSSEVELIQQRATDVEDIKQKLLEILLGVEQLDLKHLPQDSVLVDGTRGTVLVEPDGATLEQYQTYQASAAAKKQQLEQFRGRPTQTRDGKPMQVLANIGTPPEAVQVTQQDGEGVGLFRTEFLYMNRTEAPDEATQYQAYRQVCEELSGKPVIIRTLDVGGDKDIPYLHLEPEDNPFLGCRAVRYCLRNPDTFRTQLTALMRAGAESGGQLWVMLPMVATVTEFQQVRALAEDIAQQTGLPLPKLGTMIETPAAMLMADVLAKYCDFFSIGTNDLIQYLMAADRGNPNVAYLYQACDPAVLRALRSVIQAGVQAGIPVGLCGEMASDALLIPVLLGFGLERFSVNPSAILNTSAVGVSRRRRRLRSTP